MTTTQRRSRQSAPADPRDFVTARRNARLIEELMASPTGAVEVLAVAPGTGRRRARSIRQSIRYAVETGKLERGRVAVRQIGDRIMLVDRRRVPDA